ncbi:hypothetical protein [Cohnella luojiensis]|uniref:Uncharacterized protein n=1 Tax=Cohnella luojiensis TaxID=652876 RepID=A0A4Y8LUJ6_9BACL|nr:hypothetical protein [Cohnella luojiensis]TFE24719.1 hypothetical protein E2980_15375 [Cohnella luojiensis]
MNRQELHIKVRSAVHQLIHEKGYASPLDLFVKMGKISSKLVEEWRFGRVPYLERVLHGNLAQFSFIMAKLRETAREMDLKESYTVYLKWGKGPKCQLRFSKSGDTDVERNYSTHFIVKKPKAPLLAQDELTKL